MNASLVNIVAGFLYDSCMTLEHALKCLGCENKIDDEDFLADLDDRVFCCEDCGWWEETDLLVEEGNDTQTKLICPECAEKVRAARRKDKYQIKWNRVQKCWVYTHQTVADEPLVWKFKTLDEVMDFFHGHRHQT